VDTEMCSPKFKCGCQYFILLTLKNKNFMDTGVLDFFNKKIILDYHFCLKSGPVVLFQIFIIAPLPSQGIYNCIINNKFMQTWKRHIIAVLHISKPWKWRKKNEKRGVGCKKGGWCVLSTSTCDFNEAVYFHSEYFHIY
jgi:hypothetical protein